MSHLHEHVWEPQGEPAEAGSTGYEVRCPACGETRWQDACWHNGPSGVWGFWAVGEPREVSAP
jgi:uncharacterized protein (DUF983 family)